MAQERPLTPEKQLLKFIESSKLNPGEVSAQAIRRHSLSFFNFGAWLGRVSFLKVKLEKWRHGFSLEQLNVKVVNRFLGFLIALFLIYFFSNLLASLINLNKIPHLESEISVEKIQDTLPQPPGLKKAVSYYSDKARERNFFAMGWKKANSLKPGIKQAASAKTLEAAGNLKLVGISWSNDPDAMIEDSKAVRTFFVKRGQMVGEAKVSAIFKDKVVLSYDGEEVELR